MNPPLVLLHGFTGSPASFDALVAATRARRVLRPALPHHLGGNLEVTGFDEAVDVLAARVRDAGFAGAHLVGYSMGARLGLGLLVRHPGLFSEATLIAARSGLRPGPERWARRKWEEKWTRRLRHQDLETFVDNWEQLPTFASQTDAQRAMQRPARLAHDPESLARALETMGLGAMPDLAPSLDVVRLPVRLVVGEKDTKFVHCAQDLAQRLPDGKLVRLAGGHNPLVEAPVQLAAVLDAVSARPRLASGANP